MFIRYTISLLSENYDATLFCTAFYLKLFGGPHGVAAAEAEAFVVDGVVTAVVREIWVTRYRNIISFNVNIS